MMEQNKYRKPGRAWFIAGVVSLGGFLFGFDAGVISGVMAYAGPEFNLNDIQTGWVVSSPSFAAMIAMLVSGRLSDILGRKAILVAVAFLYFVSALLSAIAIGYDMLWISRMIGGLAFGAALILAPTYIAEISSAGNRGKLVSLQQLNIVLGFFAAFLSNYYLNNLNMAGSGWFTDENVWRLMLGLEMVPALAYFILVSFVPRSPRWLYLKNKVQEAKAVLLRLHSSKLAEEEAQAIEISIAKKMNTGKVRLHELVVTPLRLVFFVGLALGVIQQATGINAVYFYATSIFQQTGIGTNAAFGSGVLMSVTTVVATLIAILLIDKMGRRPLLLIGIGGIAVSMLICGYGFQQATYQLGPDKIAQLKPELRSALASLPVKEFQSDIAFKQAVKTALGTQEFARNEGDILMAATEMNATLVLLGILGFIACFGFSLGPVMWVMLSEMYPNKYRGLAIGVIGFANSFTSWLVQQVFPWELSNLGNASSFYIFGAIALVGFFLFLKILPETKGKSLEKLEAELTAS